MSLDAALRSVGHFARCRVLPVVIDALSRAGNEDSGWGVPMPVRAPDLRAPAPPSGCADEPGAQ